MCIRDRDRASIGFDLWEKLKRQGVYFITRSKKGLKFTEEEELSFDKDDEVNQGGSLRPDGEDEDRQPPR